MNILHKLCIDNAANSAARKDTFVKNAAGQTLYIRGVIAEGFDASAANIVAEIANADPAQTLNVRFNTPGGDVFQGKEIAAAIRNYPGKTVAHIDSLCASAGTSIAIECDEVEMRKGAFFMIHNAHGGAFGTKKDLRERAELLEKVELSIVDDYTAKTGKPVDEVIAMMDATTWMTAEEALEHGFIDRIAGEAKVSNAWNLSAYEKVPEALANAEPSPEPIAEPKPEPVPEPPQPTPDPSPEPAAPINSMRQTNANRLALITAL